MNKYLKLRYFVLLCLAIIGLFAVMAISQNTARKKLETDLNLSVKNLKNKQLDRIDFSQITSFSWERMFIFTPYTSYEEIDRVLGYFWIPARFTLIETHDYINLLVFVKKGVVIQYVEYHTSEGKFDRAYSSVGYPSDNSRFVMDDNGFIIWEPK